MNEILELSNEDSISAPEDFPQAFPVVLEELSYEEFFNTFIRRNQACLLRIPGLVQSWQSFTDWNAGKDECHLEFLGKKVPLDAKVPVAKCGEKYFDSQKKVDMTLREYLHYWKNRPQNEDILYLKDWHFRRQCPKYSFYRTPKYFASDWLNEHWDSQNLSDDYKFVYVGPKGSWTPFHSDVFGSFSWSANVVGQKRWFILPPGEENKLRNLSADKLVYNISDFIQPSNVSTDDDFEIKSLDIGGTSKCHYYEVIQRSGEIIFVPSGWHHQVENVQDTMSINHNWFNGANISSFVWKGLSEAYDQVRKEISDCEGTASEEEFEKMCQDLLRLSHGMNFKDFISLLHVISTKRINYLMSKSDLDYITFDSWILGEEHTVFDLKAIHQTLKIMNENIGNFDRKQLHEILTDVENVLQMNGNFS